MKNIYKLTNAEVWALATLIHLPIENGSILAQWLTEFDAPLIDSVTRSAINTLEAKGYLDSRRGGDVIPEDLLEGLTVLAISCVRLTAAIQRSGKFTWSYFGQLNETIVQYDTSGEGIQIHSPARDYEMSSILVPSWFQVVGTENFSDTLPFGGYLLLVTAFQLEDIQAALDADGYNITFSRSKLIDTFIQSQEWVDIYNAIGIPGIQPVSRMPIKDYLEFLLQRGYFQQVDADALQLGPRAIPLRATYSDPNRCTLTISIDGTGANLPPTGSLIYGNGRLFLAQIFDSGQFAIQQLNNLQAAVGWTANLLARGAAVQPTLPAPPPTSGTPAYAPNSYGPPAQPASPSPPVGGGQQFYASPAPQHSPPAYTPPPPAYTPQPVGYQPPPAYVPQIQGYQTPPKKKNSCCLITFGIGVLILLCLGTVIGGAMLLDIDLSNILNFTTQEGKAPIVVVNNSAITVCYLYVSPSSSEDLGNDILGNDKIEPGETWTGFIDTGITVDLIAVDCAEGLIDIQYTVSITSEGITYTLEPQNP